jgi:hypothetical protein
MTPERTINDHIQKLAQRKTERQPLGLTSHDSANSQTRGNGSKRKSAAAGLVRLRSCSRLDEPEEALRMLAHVVDERPFAVDVTRGKRRERFPRSGGAKFCRGLNQV